MTKLGLLFVLLVNCGTHSNKFESNESYEYFVPDYDYSIVDHRIPLSRYECFSYVDVNNKNPRIPVKVSITKWDSGETSIRSSPGTVASFVSLPNNEEEYYVSKPISYINLSWTSTIDYKRKKFIIEGKGNNNIKQEQSMYTSCSWLVNGNKHVGSTCLPSVESF